MAVHLQYHKAHFLQKLKGSLWLIEKWYSNKSISEKWKKFITVKDSTPGKMYGNVKTHKIGNPTRVITSGCNTATESLSIFVENVLYDIASELPSRIKDTITCWTLLTT